MSGLTIMSKNIFHNTGGHHSFVPLDFSVNTLEEGVEDFSNAKQLIMYVMVVKSWPMTFSSSMLVF